MKQVTFLAFFGLVSIALALQIPLGQVTMHDDAGNLVGSGKLTREEFELDLLKGFVGFAVMTVRQPDGATLSYEVVITATGDILVVSHSALVSLRDTLRQAGVEVEISREDHLGHKKPFSGDDEDDIRQDDEDDVGEQREPSRVDDAYARQGDDDDEDDVMDNDSDEHNDDDDHDDEDDYDDDDDDDDDR